MQINRKKVIVCFINIYIYLNNYEREFERMYIVYIRMLLCGKVKEDMGIEEKNIIKM